MGAERGRWLEFDEVATLPRPAVEDPFLLMLQARQAYLEGDYEPALRLYSQALKADKGLQEAWAAQVRCLVQLGELREARSWAEKADRLFPESALIASARAYALASSGLVDQALGVSDRALETAGHCEAQLWLERGAILLRLGRVEPAQNCFGKVKELHPHDPDWAQLIALEHLEAGLATRAAGELALTQHARPERAYAWVLVARAALKLGNRRAALQALDLADGLRRNYRPSLELRGQSRRPCWIAGVVFGLGDPRVQTLRRWRERAWLTHPLGRAAARIYDWSAPPIARWLADRPRLRGWAGQLLQRIAAGKEQEYG